ncbi:DUF3231 family protein [Anoxybacteroides tepidamans]|uniref:DUF3231 family protein n=1 Tax=Anoxybacteroides tepidamans TaxID=265948 RepID=UPI0004877512|nr:DUF3231 family protein [Anoxybacillus tepidamans]
MDERTPIDVENMEITHKVDISAPEIASLWSQYQVDTMVIGVYKYMLQIIEDQSIRSVLELALNLAENHVKTLKQCFQQEGFPIPHAFTENDVDLTAPRLYADDICLKYTFIMSINGLSGYAAALATSTRKDIRDFYVKCQEETIQLFNISLDLLLRKGILSKPPYIPPADNYKFYESKLEAMGLFGNRRPLNSIEINNIFWDAKKIQLTKAFVLSFAQVAKSEKIRKYFWKGVQIYGKHIEILERLLADDHLPRPRSREADIIDSTVPPFSDRLMLYHQMVFTSTTMAMYGTALATCQRADISTSYARLLMELGKYNAEASNLMIEHRWLEEAPTAPNRKQIVLHH